MPKKPTSWGIKAYVLGDSRSGYTYKLQLYLGRETDLLEAPGYSKTEQVVLTLMNDLLDKGHHLFTDRYYTSIPLLQHLSSHNTSMTGTINKSRRLLPAPVRTLKLKKDETKVYAHDNSMVLVWRDKR